MSFEDCCPLCINPFVENEKHFRPCQCGFRLCVWCFYTIVNNVEELCVPRCPGCRRDYDVDVISKQRPPPQSKRPPRRSHPSRRELSELVLDDGLNVAMSTSCVPMGLLELSAELLRTHQWLGRYGRTIGAVVNAETGAAVCRFLNREDAQRAVQLCEDVGGASIFICCGRERDDDDDEEGADEKGADDSQRGAGATAASQQKQSSHGRRRGGGGGAARKKRSDDGLLFAEYRIRITAVPTRYCSSFLKNEECKRPHCVEVHKQLPPKVASGIVKSGASASALSIFGLLQAPSSPSSPHHAKSGRRTNAASNNHNNDDDGNHHGSGLAKLLASDGPRIFSSFDEWTAAFALRFKQVLNMDVSRELQEATRNALALVRRRGEGHRIVIPLFPAVVGVDELRVTTK